MTDAVAPRHLPTFSPKVVLAVILVGVFSFSALAVLSAYAPDLRSGSDGGGHALSKSAVGFAGLATLLKAQGVPTVISRSPKPPSSGALLVLTPPPGAKPGDLTAFGQDRPTLIVLPKWDVTPDPLKPGWVRKADLVTDTQVTDLLKGMVEKPVIHRRTGPGKASPDALARHAAGTNVPHGPIDRTQTLSGGGLRPLVGDAEDRILVASLVKHPKVYILADPDLLNTQGLARLEDARAAVRLIDQLREPGAGVVFDVSLNGFARSRSLLRVMLEPPLLGATLCAVAAAILAGLHALGRFGQPLQRGRAFALGKAALVDSSAGLIRMSGKEAQLAPAYAEQAQALAARAAGVQSGRPGETRTDRLLRLSRVRGAGQDLQQLIDEAARARTRADLLAAARKLHQWRLEITREHQ